jgi:hypothetical protein
MLYSHRAVSSPTARIRKRKKQQEKDDAEAEEAAEEARKEQVVADRERENR